jgi:uncharacterized protein YyaL (SSP411 family)
MNSIQKSFERFQSYDELILSKIKEYNLLIDANPENNKYKEALDGIFRAPFTVAAQYPLSFAEYLKVLMRYYNTKQILIVIALDEKESNKSLILDYLASCNHLHFSVIWKHLDESFEDLGISFLSEMQPLEQTTTFYVCDKFKCYKPALTLEDLKKLISSL